jgi:hypothetical protein
MNTQSTTGDAMLGLYIRYGKRDEFLVMPHIFIILSVMTPSTFRVGLIEIGCPSNHLIGVLRTFGRNFLYVENKRTNKKT